MSLLGRKLDGEACSASEVICSVGPSQGEAPSNRRKACVRCYKLKTKCDKNRPSCAKCTRKGIECVYSASCRTTSKRRNYRKSLSDHHPTNPGNLEPRSTEPPPEVGGLSRLVDKVDGPVGVVLPADNGSENGEQCGDPLIPQTPVKISELNLSLETDLPLLRAFRSNVLPWLPLFGHEYCIGFFMETYATDFRNANLYTAMTLLLLALGAISQNLHWFEKSQEPGCSNIEKDRGHFVERDRKIGLNYFQAAFQMINISPETGQNVWSVRHTHTPILVVQYHIMISLYYLFWSRPLEANQGVQSASMILAQLLSSQMINNVVHEHVQRAFWACYFLEHELQLHGNNDARWFQSWHDSIPLPMPKHDEGGMHWFLSEISLKRIISNFRRARGCHEIALHEPLVIHEIVAQMKEWHDQLPEAIAFPLNSTPLEYRQICSLRGQYYAGRAIAQWGYITTLFSMPVTDSQEYSMLASHGQQFFKDATTSVFLIAHLLRLGSSFLRYANLFRLYTVTTLLVYTYNAPTLTFIRYYDLLKAIKCGQQCLARWSVCPAVKTLARRVEKLARQKGIGLDRGELT